LIILHGKRPFQKIPSVTEVLGVTKNEIGELRIRAVLTVDVKVPVPNHIHVEHGANLLHLVGAERLGKVAAPVQAIRGRPVFQCLLAVK
jgi:hypothetical protein